MMAAPREASDGYLELGDAPGLGIDWDEEKLAATRVEL
jgi:L-alanine-DL-glutamate epimerase-like enolase superfamily enzyme